MTTLEAIQNAKNIAETMFANDKAIQTVTFKVETIDGQIKMTIDRNGKLI